MGDTQVSNPTPAPETNYDLQNALKDSVYKNSIPTTPEDRQGDNEPEELNMTPIDVNGWNGQKDGTDSAEQIGRPELSTSQEMILDAARENLGQEMWRNSPHADATQNGRLGAAASVSEILKASGHGGIDSPSVKGVVQQMEDGQFTKKPLSEGKPGDVFVIDHPSGRGQLIGIMGRDGRVMNQGANGRWISRPMPQNARGHVYSPPETCPE